MICRIFTARDNAMKSVVRFQQVLILITLVLLTAGRAHSQTLLFTFDDGPQGWGSFGAITTDVGSLPGTIGSGRYHTGDYSVPDVGNFGIVDVSPPGQNLSSFQGISIDARFVDQPGFD